MAFPSRASEETLTASQREVFQPLAKGRGMKEISFQLRISARSFEFHKYRIMDRLNLHSLAELTKYAVRHGITEE